VSPQEATQILRIALEGAAQQPLDDDRVRFLALHLVPLPFERTRDGVHRYVANHKWISSLEELLDACGLPPDDRRAGLSARADLVRAVRAGGRLVPDLRSVSGWAYVPDGAALPPGAVEAERVAAEHAPPALPAPSLSDEARRANLRRLGRLLRELGPRRVSV
jgi:hypothetical protein